MKTVVYLIRHSQPMKNMVNITNNDSLQIINEKTPLSIIGEKKAEELSDKKYLENIDLVVSSNYVRAISTAKYIVNKNTKDLYINENFGERRFGVNTWDELPQDFEIKQINEPNFKLKNGESQNEVATRMYNSLMKLISDNKGKKVVIVSHATAITFLLMKLCNYKENKLYFNNEILMDEEFRWNAPEVFELVFDENNKLVNVKNIR